jgi:hypothetical protein
MNPMFVVLLYGNNSPNVARNYYNILILVVTYSYHNGQNLCGEKQLRQYNQFVVKGLFQQREFCGVKGLSQRTICLWHKPIATLQAFVVKVLLQQSYIWWRQIVATETRLW